MALLAEAKRRFGNLSLFIRTHHSPALFYQMLPYIKIPQIAEKPVVIHHLHCLCYCPSSSPSRTNFSRALRTLESSPCGRHMSVESDSISISAYFALSQAVSDTLRPLLRKLYWGQRDSKATHLLDNNLGGCHIWQCSNTI